jgi:PTH1 family peptidyl-tRNA hydrolase
MSSGIQLIIGLGNPGAEYEKTRHNAGAWFVSKLSNHANVVLHNESKFRALHTVVNLDNHDCHLLVPTTFMNLSGQAVAAFVNFYKIAAHSILIAHDEIDLPTGDIRLKFDGGHGGHNGLRDIISHLNTKQFYRLRIGIGRPNNSKEVADYVLHPPKKAERKHIDESIEQAINILPFILRGEFQKAMNILHTTKDNKEE